MLEGQNCAVSGDSGFQLREGHWRKQLCSFGCQGKLRFLRIIQFHHAREHLEGCRCEVLNSRKLDEARLLGKFWNLAKCGISGTDVNSDRT